MLRKILLPVSALLLTTCCLQAQTAALVLDIIPGSVGGYLPSGEIFVAHDSIYFFSANDGVHGIELWRSNGTPAGTWMVKDIQPGATGSNPIRFTVLNNNIVFWANDGTHGDEPWISDGTETGTKLLKDINAGPANSIRRDYDAQDFDRLVLNNVLYFAADNGAQFSQLWKSDGTETGTLFTQNVCPDCTANSGYTGYFTAIQDNLYFVGGNALWRSNGSPFNTVVAFDLTAPGGPQTMRFLKAVGDSLYFAGGPSTSSPDLWISDGTLAGTKQIFDLPGKGLPRHFTPLGDQVYFVADKYLWQTDGTGAGTVQASTLEVSYDDFYNAKPYVWKNAVYYIAMVPGLENTYLYKKENGYDPVQVHLIHVTPYALYDPQYFASNDDRLFCKGYDYAPNYDFGIISVDSSLADVQFIPFEQDGFFCENLALTNDYLFFCPSSSIYGYELWALPLTPGMVSTQLPENARFGFRVFPTIASTGVFTLHMDENTPSHAVCNVYASDGRCIVSNLTATPGAGLDLQSQPAGMYFIHLVVDGVVVSVQRVVKP